MAWQSMTRQFGPREMSAVETLSAEELVQPILDSDPIVALRLLAELMLHNDSRLRQLLANPEISAHWQKYTSDLEVDTRDLAYAVQFSQG